MKIITTTRRRAKEARDAFKGLAKKVIKDEKSRYAVSKNLGVLNRICEVFDLDDDMLLISVAETDSDGKPKFRETGALAYRDGENPITHKKKQYDQDQQEAEVIVHAFSLKKLIADIPEMTPEQIDAVSWMVTDDYDPETAKEIAEFFGDELPKEETVAEAVGPKSANGRKAKAKDTAEADA